MGAGWRLLSHGGGYIGHAPVGALQLWTVHWGTGSSLEIFHFHPYIVCFVTENIVQVLISLSSSFAFFVKLLLGPIFYINSNNFQTELNLGGEMQGMSQKETK